MLTARLKVEFIDTPVLEVVGERKNTHLFYEMQLPGSIEVEDRSECSRMPVEVELHSVEAAVATKQLLFMLE